MSIQLKPRFLYSLWCS